MAHLYIDARRSKPKKDCPYGRDLDDFLILLLDCSWSQAVRHFRCRRRVRFSDVDHRINHATGTSIEARALHDILELRSNVFIVEQQCIYDDVDGRDIETTTQHLWVTTPDDQAVTIATLRILDDGAQRRIGRVATHADHRGKGLAALLVRDALDRVEGTVVLSAQSYLLDWYSNFGFEATGPEFDEDGIPHIPMRLET